MRVHNALLLFLCADLPPEEKLVSLADCYEVNKCGSSGNLLIPLLNIGVKDTNQ